MELTDIQLERFWEKVDVSDPCVCWEWNAAKHGKGYGAITIDSKVWLSHRVSWIIHYGDIPDGMFICHHCDNRSCVNPTHLFLGDNSANMLDMYEKGRGDTRPRGTQTWTSKLTEEDVVDIFYDPDSSRVIAKKYGIAHSGVSNIKSGKSWKHVTKDL